MKILSVLFSSVLASSAVALPKCTELTELWKKVYEPAIGAKETLDGVCQNDPAKLAEALHLLATALPKTFRFTVGLIDETLIVPEDPFYNASMGEGRTMRLYDGFFRKGLEDRAATLVHEASHNVTDDHVECLYGAEVGAWQGCDEEFMGDWEGGAYNYHFMTLQALRKQARNHHDIKRAVIDAKARYMLLNRFNFITLEQIIEWGAKPMRTEDEGRLSEKWL